MTNFLERVSFKVQLCIKGTYFDDYFFIIFFSKGFTLNLKLRLLGVTNPTPLKNNLVLEICKKRMKKP
jgi:hypothetical protein